MKKLVPVIFGAVLLAALPAAAETRLVGAYGSWNVYVFDEGGGKVCYMSAAPERQSASVKNVKRGPAYFYITHRTADSTRDVISVELGYPLADDSVIVEANGQDFGLFTKGETAWARDAKTDSAIAVAVQKGSQLVVKGMSTRGTKTTDTYSLKGSGDAYKAMGAACE